MWIVMLACGRPAELDTGAEPLPTCSRAPCASDLASAVRVGEPGSRFGRTLAVVDGGIAVAAPLEASIAARSAARPSASLVSASDGSLLGSWSASRDGVGAEWVLAGGDVDGDGRSELAIGREGPGSSEWRGQVDVVSAGVSGEADLGDAALLTIVGDSPDRNVGGVGLGWDLAIGDGGAELWVAGGVDGAVEVFSTAARGVVHEDQATRALQLGGTEAVERWDGDGDGVDDLVAAAQSRVSWFRGPWTAVSADDRDGEWALSDPGWALRALDDVTGDGSADLAFHDDGAVRIADGPPPETPLRISVDGAGDIASGDLDGDGQADLVVAGFDDRLREVLVFRGPLAAGTLTEADADARVWADGLQDDFGITALAVTAGELVVGAPGWSDGQDQGAVYLIPGSSLQ